MISLKQHFFCTVFLVSAMVHAGDDAIRFSEPVCRSPRYESLGEAEPVCVSPAYESLAVLSPGARSMGAAFVIHGCALEETARVEAEKRASDRIRKAFKS